MPGYDHDKRQELLAKLGKYNLGKCCLTFKRLDDVDKEVLGKVIKSAWDELAKMYPIEGGGEVKSEEKADKQKSTTVKKKGVKRKTADEKKKGEKATGGRRVSKRTRQMAS